MLLVSFSPLHADARVLKQIKLFGPKYELTTVGYGPTPPGVSHHIQIPDTVIYWKKSRPLLILRLYSRAYWQSEVIAWLRKNCQFTPGEFAAVWVNDLDPLPWALSLQSRQGVHADLHEYAPREKEDVWRWRLFVQPYIKWLTKKYLPQTFSRSGAAPMIGKEYEKHLGLKFDFVPNAAPFWDLSPSAPQNLYGAPQPGTPGENQNDTQRVLRIVHSGIARPSRQIETMISAAAALQRPAIFDLYLTGGDMPYRRDLIEKAHAASNERVTVRVLDPVPYAQLITTLNRYDVGLVYLPPINFNHRWALPNKLYDYIQARLCVVACPSPEIGGQVRELGVGQVCEDFSAPAITHTLNQLSDQQVSEYKQRSHQVAPQVAAENVVGIWDQALEKLLNA